MAERAPIERRAYSLREFGEAFRLSHSNLKRMLDAGTGPRTFHVGRRVLISVEAANEWLAKQEQHSA
jgi:hypothetical protein